MLLPGEIHMDALDLLPRKVFLDAQVQSYERERHLDGFRLFVRLLCGKGIDDVLMNERGIPMAERVAAQFEGSQWLSV